MTWKLFQIGYNFYFQEQCLDTMIRDQLHKTLEKIESLENPLDYENVLTTCPSHKRVIIKLPGSEYLLGIIIHWKDDPQIEYRNSIELVKVISPLELLD